MSYQRGKVFIIAEAGVNHNGSMDMAYKLIDAAVEAGVDAVKFQTGKPEKVVAKWAVKAQYQEVTTGSGESQLDMIKKIALPNEAFADLKAYCERKNIMFFSTPFEIDALHYLMRIGMKIIKIPSGEITNLPFLREIAKYRDVEVILSTGMCEMKEVHDAVHVLKAAGVKSEHLTVLHCNTEYPTPYEDVHLKAMLSIGSELKTTIGYSDHTAGIEVSIAAVALGARVIEKHFTLDRTLPGPDHLASLEPSELKELVRTIRHVEAAISGNEIKTPSNSEKKNISIARRSIVAARNIKKGEILTSENLTCKRPATGISPMRWDEVVGTKATADYLEDDLIQLNF